MSLERKFEFLKRVKMPTQKQFNICVKEYAQYKGAYVDCGKYGYLILYNNQDQVADEKSLNEEFYEAEHSRLSLNVLELIKKGKKIIIDIDDFVHIKIDDEHRLQTECRLYLRLLPRNVYKVALLLMTECANAGLPTHFKFKHSSRLDNLVLYTNYDNAQAFVNIINSISQKHPELFKNSTNIHPLWGNINGYIGFMEEPVISVPVVEGGYGNLDKSANTYRTKLLEGISKHFSEHPYGLCYATTSFIEKFASRLDIDSRYYPLNRSSVIELENANYNLEEIGSLYHTKQLPLHTER